MRDDIKILLNQSKYEEAILKCKELLQNDSNNPDLWYSLFLAENGNYINTNFNELKNELAFNKAIETAKSSDKWMYISEYNLYRDFEQLKELSILFRYNQMNDFENLFKYINNISKETFSFSNVDMDDFFDGLEYVISQNGNEISYNINVFLVNILYLKTKDKMCYSLYNDLLTKAKRNNISLLFKKLENDLDELLIKTRLIKTKIYSDSLNNEMDFILDVESFLAENKKQEAKEILEHILKLDYSNGLAYLYLLLIDLNLKKINDLSSCNENYSNNKNYQRALKYLPLELKETLESYLNDTLQRNPNLVDEEKEIEVPKKKKNKLASIISILLSVIILISGIVIIQYMNNLDKEEYDPLEWFDYEILSENTCKIIMNRTYDSEIVIPEEVELGGRLFNVVEIGDVVFKNLEQVEKVVMGSNVVSIGYGAFENCPNLKSIELSSNLQTIKDSSFKDCVSLEEIRIPNDVTVIEYQAFANCISLENVIFEEESKLIEFGEYVFNGCEKLKNINFPVNLKIIGTGLFANCISLEEVVIPKNVESIGVYTFENCDNLFSINVDSLNQYYDSRSNCNAIIETSTNKIIAGCKSTEIVDGIESIEYHAFVGIEDIVEISIPSSVIEIANGAFSGLSGVERIIVDSNNAIYDSRDNCNAIIKTSDNDLLLGCKTTVIPTSIVTISSAFEGNESIENIDIPEGVKEIGHRAFYKCSNLKSITISSTVETMGNYSFGMNNSLESIIISELNSKYDSRDNCNAIIETDTNTLIFGCKTTVIPTTVTTLESHAFESCIELEEITIPRNIQTIGTGVFANCTNLKKVTIWSSTLGHGMFYGCTKLVTLNIQTGVETIGESAFYDCDNLGYVKIPNTVKIIEADAFSGCDNLVTVIIPKSVEVIGKSAFLNCDKLSIYVEHTSAPLGWESRWYGNVTKIYWGHVE